MIDEKTELVMTYLLFTSVCPVAVCNELRVSVILCQPHLSFSEFIVPLSAEGRQLGDHGRLVVPGRITAAGQ